MERALAGTLTLLAFVSLTAVGWRAYRAVETYRRWATDFTYAKYDPLAALGWRDRTLCWGKPTWRGVQQQQSLSLDDVSAIALEVDQQQWQQLPEQEPSGKTIRLVLLPQAIAIPFTELGLAIQWWRQLAQAIDQDLE